MLLVNVHKPVVTVLDCEHMCGFIVQHRPHLMFLHLGGVDLTGHAYYWGSPEYYAAAKVSPMYNYFLKLTSLADKN